MRILLILTLTFLITNALFAQQLAPAGGGEYNIQQQDQCLSETERISIKAQLADNVVTLKKKGLLQQQKGNIPAFDFPLRKAPGFTFSNYFGLSNYVDHDPVATGTSHGSSNLDYNCGNRSYDNTNGYNHAGIDYYLWPFAWYMYDNDLVEVIAAEAGTIIGRYDGNFDRNCSCSGSWNAIYLQHADGTVSWYGHLKQNSLTSKVLGQSVSKGEYLGVVASSGCSTWPHLHFEVYDNNNNLVDPYSGPCNSMNTDSYWANQENYTEPQINAVLTHDAVPVHSCQRADEQSNISNQFTSGQLVYFATYYRDQLTGSVSAYRIRQPNNSIWQSWSHTSPDNYDSSWWYWPWNLPNNAASGQWTFEVDYNGTTVVHPFYVNSRPITLNVQVNLEGAFDLSTQTMLNEIQTRAVLPEGGQPYNTAPWSYNGMEGIGWQINDYPANTVDWVLLSFRTSLQPSTEIAKRAAVLLTDGTLYGMPSIQVENGTNSLFVVVEHRNHLPVMSAQAIPISSNSLSYDFRQTAGYLGNSGFSQKQLMGGSWAMYASNADQSNPSGYEITGADRILWDVENGNFDLYLNVDFNLDGDVNGEDKVLWNRNNGVSSTVPR